MKYFLGLHLSVVVKNEFFFFYPHSSIPEAHIVISQEMPISYQYQKALLVQNSQCICLYHPFHKHVKAEVNCNIKSIAELFYVFIHFCQHILSISSTMGIVLKYKIYYKYVFFSLISLCTFLSTKFSIDVLLK